MKSVVPVYICSFMVMWLDVGLCLSLGRALSNLSVWSLCHSALKTYLILFILSSFLISVFEITVKWILIGTRRLILYVLNFFSSLTTISFCFCEISVLFSNSSLTIKIFVVLLLILFSFTVFVLWME